MRAQNSAWHRVGPQNPLSPSAPHAAPLQRPARWKPRTTARQRFNNTDGAGEGEKKQDVRSAVAPSGPYKDGLEANLSRCTLVLGEEVDARRTEGKISTKGLRMSWWGFPSLCESSRGREPSSPLHHPHFLQSSHHCTAC